MAKTNENLNLVEVLKKVPKGTKLWSPVIGECEFVGIVKIYSNPIRCRNVGDESAYWYFTSNGCFLNCEGAECVLFPSKENRDWGTFKVPKAHKHFEPFEKVLIRTWSEGRFIWVAAEYSNYDEEYNIHYIATGLIVKEDDIIPYEGNENKLGKSANCIK